MSSCYLFAGALIIFFARAIHVGTNLRGCRTSATFKREHFMTTANAIPKKETIQKSQCRIQMYFGTVSTVLEPKKMHSKKFL